ncbi:TrbG/VirB9 family P-type conjugative transfer protein [uncultured Ruegeria sp.]|uniref:TrbG/VirB9 family P-type conjugative transfer protein n=1 Tax=uncultured Ruegeria sp. TaxID=259304 RepID=UPI002623C33B|nr:TrbG/VirB9 family P-type conjugative transfer protein [uncultured Ruegeria sp.]
MLAETETTGFGGRLHGIVLAASLFTVGASPGTAQDTFEEEVFGPTDAPVEQPVSQSEPIAAVAENPVEEQKPAEVAPEEAAPAAEVKVAPKAAPEPRKPNQIELTRKAVEFWEDRTGVVTPGPDGRVIYVYGQSIPTLLCSPGMICVVELEPGEILSDTPAQSDTARWQAELRYRDGDPPQFYFAFKPSEDAPAVSNFVIFTDKRMYSIKLVKDLFNSTPILSFDYPDTRAKRLAQEIEEIKQKRIDKANAAKAERRVQTARTGVSTTRGAVPASELDFNYSMYGKAPFRPLRVYNDGRKTYVDLPAGYRGDLPVVIGGRAEANRAFNYRPAKGGKQIIIDKVLGKFELRNGRKAIRIRRGS